MSTLVNSLKSDTHPDLSFTIPKGNLCEMSLKNVKTSIGKITANESAILHYIYHLSSNNKGKEFYCSREKLAEKAKCHVDTVTRVLRKLAKGGLLMLRYERQGLKKILFIDVNWLENCIVLGGMIFASATRRTLEFLKQKTADFFKILYPAKCRIKKSSEEEEKTIYSVAIAPSYISKKDDVYNNFDREGKIQKVTLMTDTNNTSNVLVGEILEPHFDMFDDQGAGNAVYFDKNRVDCPNHCRKYALDKGMSEEDIDPLYKKMRYHYLDLGKVKKARFSDWTSVWQGWVRRDIKWNSIPVARSQYLKQIENHHTPVSLSLSSPEERMNWNKELANEGFWKIPGNPDNSKFTAFYTSQEKGGNIMDTKAGWLQRGIKWHERTRTEQSPSVKAYGECKMLEIKIPDEMSDLHKRLAKRLEEQNYIAWVQTPNVGIKMHPWPTDRYTYLADYTGNCGAFTKKTVLERYRTDFDDLKIEII